MSRHVDGDGSYVGVDSFESDLVLTNFLSEMDELDQFQAAEFVDTKYKLNSDSEPTNKKLKVASDLKSPDSPSSTPRKRRNTSWLRRKQEIQSLRDESTALELRLAHLQIQHSHGMYLKDSDILTEEEEHWKSVAAIARQRCQDAQEENTRLRSELQSYSKTAEVMHDQLLSASLKQQQLVAKCAALTRASTVGAFPHVSFVLGDNEVFDQLESKINARLHELDSIIDLQPQLEGNAEHMRICREEGREAVPTAEFEYVRMFPYSRDQTISTIWELIELGNVASKTVSCTALRSADVVESKAWYTLPLDSNDRVDTVTYTMLRRFIVATGMVLLVQSCSEWSVHHKTGATWKHTTEEFGWVVVCKHQSMHSQVRTMIKLRPNDSDSSVCAPPRSTFTGAVGDVVIPSFREILTSHLQCFENVLLDSARATAAIDQVGKSS